MQEVLPALQLDSINFMLSAVTQCYEPSLLCASDVAFLGDWGLTVACVHGLLFPSP
jgi:hypothetical protein